MANTIAIAEGHDTNRTKRTTRLGSHSATGRADTWRTFTTCTVNADGSGFITVVRDGVTLHHFCFAAEDLE